MGEVAWQFLKLGTIAFGGPAAHVAMMREELVRRRGWLDDQRFVDLMSTTNLIPGPNSTELAIHLGYDRARWRGLVAAGACFIVPAAVLVTALAWAYVHYGRTPAVDGVLHGVVPTVVAIIAHALLGLVRSVISNRWLAALAVAALVAYLLGVNELVVLAAGAGLAATARLVRHASRHHHRALLTVPLFSAGASGTGVTGGGGRPFFPHPGGTELTELFLTFLKIGSVLYGSGYVLIAFLRGDFVHRLGWITEQQLLDAVAAGQITPGPLFTTATFVGYLIAGVPGALLATIAIFLPSFLFVALLTRLTDRLRATAWTSALLDGVNAAALALMAGVSWQLARAAVVDPLTVAIAVTSLVLLVRTRLGSGWLIAGGAAIGLAHSLLG